MPTAKKSEGNKLSIIIVNYKSKHFIRACLYSLKKNLGGKIPYEVILVNNDLEEKLEKFLDEFQEITLISLERNYGFGFAINRGAEIAGGEILFFLNPDTELIDDKIIQSLENFSPYSNIGIIGLSLVSKNMLPQPWCVGNYPNITQLILNNLKINRKLWMKNNYSEVPWISGGSMLIRKETFKKISGFDQKFFMYFEDIDLCLRAKKAGYKIFFDPQTKILHHSGGSFNNQAKQKSIYYASQRYYYQKHLGKFQTGIVAFFQKLLHN